VAFEADSYLRAIDRGAFSEAACLKSIVIPFFVSVLGSSCFSLCEPLCSVIFEGPSRLATIEESAFLFCESLRWVVIPASVTAISESAYYGSGIRLMEIEEGSVSFRVANELLVDFEVGPLVSVIGSPESILIRPRLRNFEIRVVHRKSGPGPWNLNQIRCANPRSIGPSGFAICHSFEWICIRSPVEVLCENCFGTCRGLRSAIFGRQSRFRLIKQGGFSGCERLEFFCVPPEIIRSSCLPIRRGISLFLAGRV
jgi:hypothetical protein